MSINSSFRNQTISRDDNKWVLSAGWFSENLMHAVNNFGFLIEHDQTVSIEEFAELIANYSASPEAGNLASSLREEMALADTSAYIL